jgi:hypothetical protein
MLGVNVDGSVQIALILLRLEFEVPSVDPETFSTVVVHALYLD